MFQLNIKLLALLSYSVKRKHSSLVLIRFIQKIFFITLSQNKKIIPICRKKDFVWKERKNVELKIPQK